MHFWFEIVHLMVVASDASVVCVCLILYAHGKDNSFCLGSELKWKKNNIFAFHSVIASDCNCCLENYLFTVYVLRVERYRGKRLSVCTYITWDFLLVCERGRAENEEFVC